MSDRAAISSRLKTAGRLAWAAQQEWIRDRCPGLAAAMAFNAILALPPFCALLLLLASRIFGSAWTRDYVMPVVLGWTGPQGAAVLQFLLRQQAHVDPVTLFSLGAISIIGLVLGAMGFFAQLQDSLESVWDVRREEPGFRVQLRKGFLALRHAIGSLLIIFTGLIAAAWILSLRLSRGGGPPPETLRWAMGTLIVFLSYWSLLSYWLKGLPPVRLAWRQVLPWAALIALLHLLGRSIFQARHAAGNAAGGINVAEALILFLLWCYYAGMVFLYCAEMMRLQIQKRGQPSPRQEAHTP